MSALFRDFAEATDAPTRARLRQWYPTDPFQMGWARSAPEQGEAHRNALADELRRQADRFEASAEARANIERLRAGAAAVVTGQQVGLFGGPLLTLLKAATAIRKAQDATRVSGRPHVPVFWLASEDHDFAEADQVHLLGPGGVQTLHSGQTEKGHASPAGAVPVGDTVEAALAQAEALLGFAPITAALRRAYTDRNGEPATLAGGFGRLMAHVFASQGLVVIDAASRTCHGLGEVVLRAAIERADELQEALVARSAELEASGYHAQVKAGPEMSLLFLLVPGTDGRWERRALRRARNGDWKAGTQGYRSEELLAILESEPERMSPNALLRPVFQDAVLPTAAYIGGPAEVAYFAQSAVLFERLLGQVTPVLPRLSATLVEPAIGALMARHEVQFPQVMAARTAEELSVRLGARAMPVEGKRRLAAAGQALDAELTPLLQYLEAMNPELGRSAEVSASKMRYQMNRLRRMAARYELERETALGKQANEMMLHLLPEDHPQERLLGGIWFLACLGDDLPRVLVQYAGQECPGHRVLFF